MKTSIIIPTSYHFSLKEGVESNVSFQDLLLSMVLYDQAYFFEYLINEKNHRVYDRFRENGLIRNVPILYVKNSLLYLQDVLSTCIKLRYLENEQLNFQYSFENLENKNYWSELKKKDTKHGIEQDNLLYKIRKNERKIRALYSFVNAYRRNRRIISNVLYEDFCLLHSIESFIECISDGIDYEVYSMEENEDFNFNRVISGFYDFFDEFKKLAMMDIERQKNYNAIYGASGTDNIPKKYYMDNYSYLVESFLLFNASLDLSLSENVILKMPFYLNHDIRAINIDKPNKEHMNDSYLQIYRLLIEDMCFPQLNNIDDLLKFKENRHLKEFKKLLFEWNESVVNDEYSSLNKIKDYLKKANEKFKYFDKIKRRPIDFYLAIPLGIVDLFLGTPLSLLPLAITSYFKIDEFITKKKYRGLIWK